MPLLYISTPIKWAHGGHTVREYPVTPADGEPTPIDDAELVDVAVREGWATTERPESAASQPDAPATVAVAEGAVVDPAATGDVAAEQTSAQTAAVARRRSTT
jgi:hypothetical protein